MVSTCHSSKIWVEARMMRAINRQVVYFGVARSKIRPITAKASVAMFRMANQSRTQESKNMFPPFDMQ